MPRLALQLYTLRDRPALSALGPLADQGYEGVELFEQHPREELELIAARLGELGLEVCGRHVRLERLEGELPAAAAEAAVVGCSQVVVPVADRPADRAGALALAERLAEVAARAADAGLRLGYHNHWWEPARLPDGTVTLEVVAGTGVDLELDLGWAWVAGADPLELVQRHAGRIPLVHVKDFRTREQGASCPVGDGAIDYAAVVAAAPPAGVEWLIVEQEEFDGDPLDATARSAIALRALLA